MSKSNPEMERAVRQDRLDAAFTTGSVFDAGEPELLDYLRTLATGHIPNDAVRHREIIRGLTINNIQVRRLIDRLDRQNRRVTVVFIVLAVLSLVSAVIQIWLQICGR
jgi:hypothetical protein